MSCCSNNNCNCHRSIKEAKEPNKDSNGVARVAGVVAGFVIASLIGA